MKPRILLRGVTSSAPTVVLVLAVWGALGLAATAIPNSALASVNLPSLRLGLQQVASGFTRPVYVTNAQDGSQRLFVVEQAGRIRVVRGGTVQPSPFLDITSSVSSGGERGLLGLAFSPQYRTTGRFYIYYTNLDGNVLVERCVASDPASDTPVISRQSILGIAQPFANHNGGGLQFGPDRYLYVGVGDGGGGGDPRDRAQRGGYLLGKMLRIDVGEREVPATFTGTYRIPPSNPLVGRRGQRGEVWARGLRNPWRFSFDSGSGHMWIGDVGQNRYEEIDFQPVGRGGLNYGWRVWEGRHRFTTRPRTVSRRGFTFPIFEYKHPYGTSVTGGYVYRGSQYPALYGTYLYADFGKGWIGGIRRYSATGRYLNPPQREKLLHTGLTISSFGVDEARELYLCGWGNGGLYQVTATAK
jgi:glucose/arabinose dehydrogenase